MTNLEKGQAVAESGGLGALNILQPLTRRSQITATLREAIFSGRLAPGAPLVEVKLAQHFGVSRGPLREAIRELSEEGLLVNRPYVGTYVVEVDEKVLTEAYDLRRVLERHAFTLIWSRRNAEFQRELVSRHNAVISAADSGDMHSEINAEMHFHRFPYEYSNSGLLLDMWEMLSQKIRLGFTLYQKSIGEQASSRDAHEQYVALALADDLGAMHLEVDIHIEAGLKTVLGFLRRRM